MASSLKSLDWIRGGCTEILTEFLSNCSVFGLFITAVYKFGSALWSLSFYSANLTCLASEATCIISFLLQAVAALQQCIKYNESCERFTNETTESGEQRSIGKFKKKKKKLHKLIISSSGLCTLSGIFKYQTSLWASPFVLSISTFAVMLI